ncbi:dihydroorotate dehydrogenase (quinone) [Thermoplasmatales archaeon SW_10_69_26]|nr:MAG: dihydroorotate dehydrogenase (quinone) [Thermoplasmatales archaeon SW_10_69_26]
MAARVYGALKPLLFRVDPERTHGWALSYLSMVQRSGWLRGSIARRRPDPNPRLSVSAMGIQFPAPLGLAAGFDKDAEAHNALLAHGFGHVEVGTVTPEPQDGNPRPRVQRFPDHRALVNWLGFPNDGQQTVADRLEEHPPEGVVGVNVGPNKDSTGEAALADYEDAAARLARYAAYLTVNVSSPNTPGLRSLQEPEQVAELVARVLDALDEAGHPRPVLLKIHPDAGGAETRQAAEVAVDAGASGIVAVNTTSEKPEGLGDPDQGGLSGSPLSGRATQVVEQVYEAVGEEVPIVGVGGVETGEDALDKIRHGATLVQAYTGFVFRGPRFPGLVHEEMLATMDDLGVDHVTDLVGEAVDGD